MHSKAKTLRPEQAPSKQRLFFGALLLRCTFGAVLLRISHRQVGLLAWLLEEVGWQCTGRAVLGAVLLIFRIVLTLVRAQQIFELMSVPHQPTGCVCLCPNSVFLPTIEKCNRGAFRMSRLPQIVSD